jgi:hypothetical protein
MTNRYNSADRWVVLKLTNAEGEIHYRLFMGWYGGYLGSDAWQMNSGITKVVLEKDGYLSFHGVSGSVYYVHPNTYGMSGYMASVFSTYESAAKKDEASMEVMPDGLDWVAFDYS